VGNVGKNDGIPSFFAILFMWVIAKLMEQFIDFMTEVASDIGGGLSVGGLAGGVRQQIAAARKGASELAEKGWNRTGGHVVKRADQALFDSGKLAKEARRIKKLDNARNQKHKAALVSAGKDGIHDYKKKNGAELANMSKEEQEKKLREVRDAAMVKKGKQLGLSPDQVEALKKDKGNKYVGDNVLGYIGKGAIQSLRSGGSLRKGIGDKKVSTSLSKSEAKKALKNTDKEGRENMMKAVREGDLKVKSGSTAHKIANFSPKKAASKKLNALKKAFKDDDKNEAIQQLVDEGEIAKMSFGTGFARSDIEKKKIRDRMKKMKIAKDASVDMNRESTVASLEMESEYLNESDEKGTVARDSNLLNKLAGNRKFGITSQDRANKEAAIKKARPDLIKSKYKAHSDSAQSAIEAAESSMSKYDDDISAVTSDAGYQEKTAELASLGKEIARDDANKSDPYASRLTKDQRKEKINRIKGIESDKDFVAQNKSLSQSYAAKNAAQAELDAAKLKKSKADKGAEDS